MKNRTRANRYSDNIAALLESDAFARQRTRRCQRRSRNALLWFLFTLLMMLVVAVSLFTSGRRTSIDWDTNGTTRSLKRHERLSDVHRPEGRHGLEISVWDYEEIQEYYHQHQYEEQEQEQHQQKHRYGDIASNLHLADWSEEQIEEMERNYKRYLEVFVKAHGDKYEPESKEVVYTEYLAYRERKAKEQDEQEGVVSEPSPHENANRLLLVEKHEDESNDAPTTSNVESPVVSRLTVPGRSTINYDPFPNEVGVSSLSRPNNDTERTSTTTALTSNTDAFLAGTKHAGDDVSARYQPVSGLGKALNA